MGIEDSELAPLGSEFLSELVADELGGDNVLAVSLPLCRVSVSVREGKFYVHVEECLFRVL